jgi:hypothetical protein
VTLSLLLPGVGWATMVVMLFLCIGQFPSIMVAFIHKTVKVSTPNFLLLQSDSQGVKIVRFMV